MLFDTHAHYDDARFDSDRDALLRAMPENGVGLILNPGCDWETSEKAVSYAETYDFVYAAVGYHPENLEGVQPVDVERIGQLAQAHPKVRAIGEIGLDYYWEKDPVGRENQKVFFRAQMALAEKLGLPVIVHDRDAHADSLAIAEEFPNLRGVFHCFAGSPEMAERLLQRGWYLSFTGVITFKNAVHALEVIRRAPLDRLMVETDAPYMAPEPFRGRRNSSLYVYRMAETIAALKGVPTDEAVQQMTENGKTLFGITT